MLGAANNRFQPRNFKTLQLCPAKVLSKETTFRAHKPHICHLQLIKEHNFRIILGINAKLALDLCIIVKIIV